MPRPGVPRRKAPRAARVLVPALACLLLQFFQAVVVHQVLAGASIASLSWHGARVAGAPPHKSLAARAPTDSVPADHAGSFVARTAIIRPCCAALVVSPARFGRHSPAACGFRESHAASENGVQRSVSTLACRTVFPCTAILG